MAAGFQIRIEIAKGIRFQPEVLRERMTLALNEAVPLVEKEVRQLTPQGVGGTASGLRASIFGEVRTAPTSLEGVVASPLPHAAPVEFGSRPHFPPVSALIPWVERFIVLEEGETAEGVAFAIARAISRRGTPAREMFQRGFARALPGVEAIFARQFGEGVVRLVVPE